MAAAFTAPLEHTAPQNSDLERTVLGLIILDNRHFQNAAALQPEDFSDYSNRMIFRRMGDLVSQNQPIDLATLADELQARRELDSVGGVEWLARLIDGVPDQPNIEHYIKRLKGHSNRRKLIAAAELVITQANDGCPLSDISAKFTQSTLAIESGTQQTISTPSDFMPEVLRELEQQSLAGGLVGLSTGIDSLDTLTGGLRAGELTVVGALAGVGKTALATQMLAANASAGIPCGFFSVEMSRWDVGKRFLPALTKLTSRKIRHPNLIAKDEWGELAAGAAQAGGWPLWVDDSGSLTLSDLLARARLFISRMGVKLLVVDYLQLIRAEGRDLRERVGAIADALRQLAKAERIPIVLLSQLRRPQNVNDPPTMSELKESSDIEYHAFVVLLIHSPLAPDGSPTGQDVIIIGKNRNGLRGPIPVLFDSRTLRFYPRETR